ncbi:MAG: TonB-dependent receptor [Flavobacteriales bacterium]|nr:TonB-dependent receptor [Flavobacteriales bacterium]MBK7113908.1 TonB-dependent receptor [Flavobacteriales bacterium]
MRSLLIGLALFPGWCLAQTITLLDRQSLQPVAGVLITASGSTASRFTNDQGRFELSALGSPTAIRFEHVSYITKDLPVTELAVRHTVYLQQRNYDLKEVVISANRFQEDKRDVPEQIAVIKARDMAFLDQPSTGDLLQNSGTLFVQKSQAGGGSPVIRGFEANRVLLVVDGVRMNNAIYRSGHLQDIMTVDQNALERIEVISGPASVAYGSDALGGVVHLFTRSAPFRDSTGLATSGGAFVRYSSANSERTAGVQFGVSGQRVSSFTSITASDFGDLRQGSVRDPRYAEFGLRSFHVEHQNGQDVVVPNEKPNVQIGTAYKQLDVLEKLRLRSGARTVHQLNLQLSTSSDVPRYDRLSEYSVTPTGEIIPAQAEWYYGPQQRLLVAYTLELEKHRAFDLARITPSFQSITQSRHTRRSGSNLLGSRTEQVLVQAINADLEKRFARHEFRYGVEAYRNEVRSNATRRDIETGATSYLSTRYPNGGSTMQSVAAYLTHTFEINEHWVLSEGIRATYVGLDATFTDDADFQFLNGEVIQRNAAFNWRIGGAYMPGRDWRFTVLGSTGFRAPNVDDLGKVFDSTPGQVVVPNPDLDPERTFNAEVGASKSFAKKVTVEVNAFHTWLTDALVVSAFRAEGRDSLVYDGVQSKVTALTNGGAAYVHGGSGKVAVEINDKLVLKNGITYTYGRLRSGTEEVPLDHIPPVFGRSGLEFRTKRIRSEVYVLYNGWKRLADYSGSGEDNLASATVDGMPAWWTLNLRASFTLSRHASIQCGIENIADANYRTFASGVSAPGRNFQVSLRSVF